VGKPETTRQETPEGTGGSRAAPGFDTVFPAFCADREGFFAFFDAVSVGLAVIDEAGAFVWVNEAYCRILGRPRDRLLGLPFTRFVADMSAERAMALHRANLENRGGIPAEWMVVREDGGRIPIHVSPGRLIAPDGRRYAVVCNVDMRSQGEDKESLKRRAFQQGIISEIGLFALSSGDIPGLFRKTILLTASVLDVEMAEVVRLMPDGTLRLEAAVGHADPEGTTYPAPEPGDMAHYVLSAKAPVVVTDYPRETRFTPPPMFLAPGMRSGLGLVVHGRDGPYGLLGAHTKDARVFSGDDVHFLQSLANVLSEAVTRTGAEAALAASNHLGGLILEAVGEGIFGIDLSGRITFVNPATAQLTGYAADTLAGADPHALWHHSKPDGKPFSRARSPILKVLEDGRRRHVREDWFWRSDGRIFPVDYVVTPLLADGAIKGAVVAFRDITERKKAEKALTYQAYHDELTGLYNRAFFIERLERAMRGARTGGGSRFSVMFLDLDDFKFVNDSLGHTVGDRLLRGIAMRLWNTLDPGDVIARLGGDEFAVLVQGQGGQDKSLATAGRIHEELKKPSRIDEFEFYVSASIGIVDDVSAYEGVDEVLRDADTAMFQAKSRGKGKSEVFDRAMHDRASERLHLETGLRRAVENGELYLAYQPIFRLSDRITVGFEALARWRHPVRGILSPAVFIPVAEASGLILALGDWVLRECCRRMRRWLDAHPGAGEMSIAANISAKQLMQGDLAARVARILDETGLDPRHLKLEITESVLMENAELAVDILGRLRDLGIRLAVDDFGTGYSSLSYLRRLPVDALKIDRSFVSNMDVNREKFEIVRAIVQLARALNLDVCAEGVETEAELAGLVSLGCGLGQGYLYARPLPAGEARAFIPDPGT
jgi:diguanylate cyclase (GGDEF)-like protein/PAS domain S-box-containing protein